MLVERLPIPAAPAVLGARGRLFAHIRTPLHRDAYALVANSAFTAVTGLLYWIVAANAYTPASLGINAALISSMMFLAGIASLNLTNVLVRFLPQAGARTVRVLTWSYGVTGALAAAAAVLFLIGIEHWSPRLAFLGANGGMQAWFVLATVGWCVFSIQDGVLTALGRAVWVPAENAFFVLLKLALLPLFAVALPDYGIFVSWSLAMLLAVGAVNLVVFARLARRVPATAPTEEFGLRDPGFRRYLGADYAGSIAWLASINLLPLIVTAVAGATANAYFALAWAVAFPLYAVSANVGTSLVLHGAAAGTSLPALVRKAALQAVLVLIPAVTVLVLIAPWALRLFGHAYSQESATLLRLLAIGAIPNIVLALAVSVARVRRRMRPAVVALTAQAALSLGLTAPLVHALGVTGAGVAWLASQFVVAALLLVATRAGLFGDDLRSIYVIRPQLAQARSWLGERRSGAARRRAREVGVAERALTDAGLTVAGARSASTESDVVVLIAGRPGGPHHAVKVACSESGERALRRQADALREVRAAAQGDGWTDIVPRVLADGRIDGYRYLVESGLPGVDGRGFAGTPACERALAAITRGVAPLYAATAQNASLATATVWDRLDVIARACGRGERGPLERMRGELTGTLEQAALPVARGHGDLWLGNALLSSDGDDLLGLVDWEASVAGELPATDLAHLVITTRSIGSGRELGDVVRRLLRGNDSLTPFESRLLGLYTGSDGLNTRTLILLAWVQHCAQRLEQGTLHARGRWLRRNVLPVVAVTS